ncbi:hypothetical protein [Sandaracinus amylolyticus]|uniref:hypothetical protein n=1 Tax=Sandaracinus amylolyticus TaxID=927083 RepID=UPI001F33D4A8|nr:hypothetical protein [Sandaracinus amylolyticus]UJR86497.1 Hypothetical protein I5071_85920 [Sandaracinus amylolyticus]
MQEKTKRIRGSWLAALVAAVAVVGAFAMTPTSRLAAQASALRIGGGSANFGVFGLNGGFLPDPSAHNVVSGGNLDASRMGLAPNCRGFVTAQPDLILRYANPASFLRLYVRAQGDTTLVVNDPNGRWYCSDDEGGSLNPMLDFSRPAGGQYDIWIGSYRAGENIRGQFFATELSGNRP